MAKLLLIKFQNIGDVLLDGARSAGQNNLCRATTDALDHFFKT
jgi:hypothetical protein